MDLFPESTEELTWMREGLCRDLAPDDVFLFFVEPGKTVDAHVLAMCRICPVRDKCVAWAYDQRRSAGYFGGMSPGQRKSMERDEAVDFCIKDRLAALEAVRTGGLGAATPTHRPDHHVIEVEVDPIAEDD